jgi:hypothetical protein
MLIQLEQLLSSSPHYFTKDERKQPRDEDDDDNPFPYFFLRSPYLFPSSVSLLSPYSIL